jgi:hypothetical protein
MVWRHEPETAVSCGARVAKVYPAQGTPFYFINGQRSDVYDEIGVLEEILGDNFKEYWVSDDATSLYAPNLMEDLEGTETIEQLEDLLEEFPDLLSDSR